MNLKSILTGPINGKVANKKLNLKESIVINLILSFSIALTFFLRMKILVSNAKSLTKSLIFSILPSEVTEILNFFGSANSYRGFVDIDPYINSALFKLCFYFILIFIAICLCVSGMMFVISKYIFNSETSFEECFSIYTYANIIPAFILIAGLLISIISGNLFLGIVYMNIICLVIFAYEGFSEIISNRKSKLIISVTISYIISFVLVNYAAISMMISSIKNSIENIF